MIGTSDLPAVNAVLNGTSALFLVAGWLAVRSRRLGLHKACMLGAVVVSTLFLCSYLTYHAVHGSRRFTGHGWVRPVYLSILASHTILAALVVPLVLRTLYLAFQDRLAGHARVARWTLPIWLYVSVTGVVVYWLLYQVYVG